MAAHDNVRTFDAGMREACTALSIAFANAVDARDYPRVLSLFTVDAVLERWDQTFIGQRAIAAMLDARPLDIQTRHICTNIEIFPRDDGEATGITYFLFFREAGDMGGPLALTGVKMIGEYHDVFRRSDSGWLIARRSIKIIFRDETAG